MSSTNRSAAREQHVSDYYVTPESTIVEFLNAFNEDNWGGFRSHPPLTILDPCAGGDSAHPMAYPAAIAARSGWRIREFNTLDIREDSLAAQKGDYLTAPAQEHDIVITNPPFNLALPIIKKALDDTRDGGFVVMLLRLNFFGSKERQAFFQSNMPLVTYVHTKRPKFLNTGGTDSIEYMHAVWQKGSPERFTQLRIV